MNNLRRLLPFCLGILLLSSACKSPGIATQSPSSAPTSRPADSRLSDPRMISVNTLRPAADDYARGRIGTAKYALPPYAEFLKGVKICLDPGHGGDAHKAGFKRGPTGVREAEVNLRVARYLRDLLLASGAEVRLTREADNDLELDARAAVANDWPADLFVSLHHNAIDNKPQTNHTTVWYHGQIDERPSSLDLARYLCQGLQDGLALPQISTVPLKSDQLMYKGGFGVLRAAKVTACLTETSFYTDPQEEQRLRRPEYNLREAYSLLLGLARYAAAGLPRVRLAEARPGSASGNEIELVLDDGLRGRKSWGAERQMIFSDSIRVTVDGQVVPHEFTNEGYRLRIALPPGAATGDCRVRVHFENMFKNSVLEPEIIVRPITTPSAQADRTPGTGRGVRLGGAGILPAPFSLKWTQYPTPAA